MTTRAAHTMRNDRGNMSWALVVVILAFVLITAFTVAVIANVKRTDATNSDIAVTQRTDAAVADALARLSDGQALPPTRDGATIECQDIDNRSVCYAYWALPRPGNAADPLRYDLITHVWDDSVDRDQQPPTDGSHIRAVRFPLEAITYTGTPESVNGRIVYQATPAGLFANGMFGFREVTLGGPDVKVGSYNSVSALDGTDNGVVASGGWAAYGRAVDVDGTRLYGTDAAGTDRTSRCTGEPCNESDVVALPHTYKLADEASVAWMRNGTANPAVKCTATVNGNWIASEQGGRITDAVLCVNGHLVIDAPTNVALSSATVVVHGNVVIEQDLNAPGEVYDWASPSRLAIYSTGPSVVFAPRQSAEPGVGVAALLYAPRAVCSTDPVNHSPAHVVDPDRDPDATLDYTGAITYSGSLVCDTISLGGSWTHAYDDAITVNYVDPVADSSKAWAMGSPDVVDPDEWETPIGWEDPTCVPPRPVNPTAWWRLSEPSGSIANDSVGDNDLGWLTTVRGDGLCRDTKGARFAHTETAASERIVTSATDGVTLEWWGDAPAGSITAAGVKVHMDETRHVSVTAGGVTKKFPFTVENHSEWHLYTVTVAPSGEAKLYVDGTHKKTVTVGSPAAGSRTAIGPGAGGKLAELVLYSRVLSPADVQQRWAAWNASVFFTATPAGTPFGAPTLSDNGTTYGHLKVKWTTPTGTFPTGSLTSYVVQRSTAQTGPFTTIGTTSTPTTTWESTSPISGELWYRTCAIYNGDQVCGNATQIVAVPVLAAPVVTVGTVTTSNARFSWTSVQHADHYERQVRENGGSWSAVATAYESNRNVDHGGQQGTRLQVRVRAVDAYGKPGPWSDIVSANLLIDSPRLNGWTHSYAFPHMYTRVNVNNGTVCAPGNTVEARYRDKTTIVSSYGPWSAWTTSGATSTTTANFGTTVAVYAYGADVHVETRCRNDASGNVGPTTGHATTIYHPMPTPSGSWVGITSWRVAGWGASCPAGTSVQYQWEIVAAFGKVGNTSWNTTTSYSNTGQAWGAGRIYMTSRCVAGTRASTTVHVNGGF